MANYDQKELINESLEFEEVKGLKVSKSFTTKKGDSISVIYISKFKALIRDKKGDLTLQVNGPVEEITSGAIAKSFLGDLWDKIKGVGGKLIDILTGGVQGGGGGCTQSTGNVEVNINVSGTGTFQPNSVNVNVQCTGPQ